jgi:hypothetical protein
VSSDIFSVLQDLIVEAIPSQKCHANIYPILNSYGDLGHCDHWIHSLDFNIWDYIKTIVYECKLDTGDEQLQRIFDAARNINDATVLCTVALSMVEHVTMCIQADGSCCENLLS